MSRKTPESLVLDGCLHYLRVRGVYHWRNSVGAVRLASGQFVRFGGKVGSSDILAVLPPNGRILCIECKAPAGRLSSDQVAFLEHIRSLGGLAIVARSFQDIDEALRQEGYADDGPLFRQSIAVMGGIE